MSKFTFHAVGQGLFYSGSLRDGEYNFVYDCGTSTDQIYIKKAINSLYNSLSSRVIDNVIISHLHYDHYSGLKELLSRFDVKRIMLPYFPHYPNLLNLILYKDMIVNNKLNIEESTQHANLITELYANAHTGNNNVSDNYRRVTMLYPEIENKITTDQNAINSYSVTEHYKDFWEFKFINKSLAPSTMKSFSDELDLLLCKKFGTTQISDSAFVDYIKNCNGKYDEIKKIYTQVFGRKSLNLTSTMLLHYPIYCSYGYIWHINCEKIHCKYKCNCGERENNSAYTLLTGDAELDASMVQELRTVINKTENIMLLQIPHHGSKKNWNSLVKNNIFARKYIISFGLGNLYGHPDKNVLTDLLINDSNYALVTQITPYKYYID